jgi:hypothetical protein
VRKNAAGVAPVAPLPPSISLPSPRWWSGNIPPLYYVLVELACINLSLCTSLVRTTWDAYMIVAMYVLPWWWIFFMRWFMRYNWDVCYLCIGRCIRYHVHVCYVLIKLVCKNPYGGSVCYLE